MNKRFIGTCTSMCPAREIKWRERESLLHKFEILEGTESSTKPKADINKVITQYARPAAGRRDVLTEDLRPPDVLLKTVHHIVKNILPRTDVSWIVINDFVTDRLRAVCQELTIQRTNSSEAGEILSYCVKFYLYSSCLLFRETNSTLYDPHINSTLLLECLKRLLILYEGNPNVHESGSFSEMESVYLVLNLGSFEAQLHALSLPKAIRLHNMTRIAMELNFAFLRGNIVRVLRSFHGLPLLLRCCLHGHLESLRRQLLLVLSVAYGSKNCLFPIQVLCRWLGMEDRESETVEMCRHYGLAVKDDEHVCFLKGKFDRNAKTTSSRFESSLKLTSVSQLL